MTLSDKIFESAGIEFGDSAILTEDVREAVKDALDYFKANEHERFNLSFEQACNILEILGKKYGLPTAFGHFNEDVLIKIFGDKLK